METTCLTVCAVGHDDKPVFGAYFEARGVDYNSITAAFSGFDGCACLPVRINSEVEVVGGIEGPKRVYTGSAPLSCGSSACTKLPLPLKVSPPKFHATLTWKTNVDLDAHFSGPCPYEEEGCREGRFHVGCSSRGSLFSAPFAHLDGDATFGPGPETISLVACFEGVYKYSVYNNSGAVFASSGAKVVLLLPDGSFQSYTPPSNPENHQEWVVGELHCSDDLSCQCTWVPINTFISSTLPPKLYT
jgi:hypothetical protein